MDSPEPTGTSRPDLEAIVRHGLRLRQETIEAFLEETCHGRPDLREEVRTRLAGPGTAEGDPAAVAVAAHEPIEREIGGYRIVRWIGEGGMGVVYEAEQRSPRRKVALKVLRKALARGSALRRFRHEAEVLAHMRHPWIAQIYEARTEVEREDDPMFLAMELVEGLSLLEHVQRHHPSLAEQLELLARVCDAVQHAHAQSIVHRDLKPSNILVQANGEPKILDFGVAHVGETSDIQLSQATEAGQMLGTFAYMSPEQIRARPGEIDPRTDVYALGIVLYEMLAGQLPFPVARLHIAEVARVLQHEDPLPLGRVAKTFRGDLEAIVQKCLQKDPKRRYESAGALADDLRRHLRHEPIRARRISRFDALGKAVRRHRALACAFGSTALALLLGAAIAIVFALQAEEARAEASREAERARRAERAERAESERARLAEGLARERLQVADAVNAFLNEDLLGSLDPRTARGSEYTVRELVERAASRVLELRNDAVRAAVHGTLGSTFYQLGDYRRACEHLEAACAVPVDGALVPLGRWLNARRALASARTHLDDLEGARRILEEDLERTKGETGDLLLQHAVQLVALGEVRTRQGDVDRARQAFQEALAIQEVHVGRHGEAALTTLEHLGDLEVRAGNYAVAAPLTEEILAARREVQGEDHPHTIRTLANVARLAMRGRDLERAEALIDAFRELVDRVFGSDHTLQAHVLSLQAELALARGDVARGRELTRERIAVLRRLRGEGSSAVADALDSLGDVELYAGRYAEAEVAFREALAILDALGDVEVELQLGCRRALASTWTRLGRTAEAEALLRESVARCERQFPEPSLSTAITRNDLAMCLVARGELAEAEALMRDSLATTIHFLGERSASVAIAKENLANVLGRLGAEGDLALLEDVLVVRRELLGASDPAVGRTLYNLGSARVRRREFERAVAIFREALEITRARLGTDHPDAAHMEVGLAGALIELAQGEEALALLEHALVVRRARFPAGHSAILEVLERRGRLLLTRASFDDAIVDLEEAATIRAQRPDVHHAEQAKLARDLGRALRSAGREADAVARFEAALARVDAEAVPGLVARELLQELLELYSGLGRSEEARRIEERLR